MPIKKIGLALSGGGARGFAHVGVLKALAENDIPVDFIAGTSIGSLVGAAFAAGMTAGEIETMARSVRWRHITRPSFSPRALLSNAPMGRFIKLQFPVQRFEDLRIPFTAVTCDLVTGEEIRLKDNGDLISAIRASCAVPAVFLPIRNGDNKLLVDGGITSPLPIDAVHEMGADVIIGVDLLTSGASFRRQPYTALGSLVNSAMTLLRAASNNQKHPADILIIPQIAHVRPDRMTLREECIELGERAAREKIEEIKRAIET